MISKRSLNKFSSLKLNRGFSSTTGTQITLNLVIRDHDQSAYANSMNSTIDPRYLQIAYLWNQGNKVGPEKIFGHIETGGQEPGKTAMSGRDSGQLYSKIHEQAPDTWLRTLSRSCYGNSVFPLHPNDLKKWYSYVNNSGKKVIFKVFDYNTNFEEMEIALQIIKEIGAPLEIAVPHSPDPVYFDFFKEKIESAATKAVEYGATLSAKRMVNGLTEEEGSKIGEILGTLGNKHGIKDITLHAHGDVPNAIAAFLHQAAQTKIPMARGDIVHRGSGGTFPNFYDVMNRLAQLGTKINPSQQQLDILKEIERLQLERDQRFIAVRVGGAFTVPDKVQMGMPDGGEAYTVEAILKAGIPEKFGVSESKAQDIFQEYYKEFRERFGMVVSVTPGHKRIEEGSLTSMLNTVAWAKDLAKRNNTTLDKIDPKVVREGLRALSYETLYEGLNPKTIDAFRNDVLPIKLRDDGLEFLCKHHMANVLKQKAFADLEQDIKDSLISQALYPEVIAELADQLVQFGKVPKEAAILEIEPYHPLSLVQAAGKRVYTEGVGAKETGPKFREAFEKSDQAGIPVSKVYGLDRAECLAILTGTPAYIDTALKHGETPSPEGFSKEEYNKAFAQFRKNISQPNSTLEKQKAAFEAAKTAYIQKNGDKLAQYPSTQFSNPELTKAIAEHDRNIEILKLVSY